MVQLFKKSIFSNRATVLLTAYDIECAPQSIQIDSSGTKSNVGERRLKFEVDLVKCM